MSTVETSGQGNGYVGQALRRKEDPPLITGKGRYTDDIVLPGQLWASIIRSPEAHARITSINKTFGEERDGVRPVLTAEVRSGLRAPLPIAWVPPGVEIHT